MTDKSNGYQSVAARFIELRGKSASGIGTSEIRRWARTLPPGAVVLDLGCGTGFPVSNVLMEEGLVVYGIDASPSLAAAFRQNFPNAPIACEAVEESSFFHRQFDAVIAVGLLFLLPLHVQEAVIHKVSQALNTPGRFLFTATGVKADWVDILTGRDSTSPGAETYRAWLTASGLSVQAEFEDDGQNHYYDAVKTIAV